MALKFFWRGEGTTLDGTHDFTAGDNTATISSAAAINTDAAKIGTNGLDIPSSFDTASFDVSGSDLMSRTVGAIGFWFRLVSFVDTASFFSYGLAAHRIEISMTGTDDATGRELRLRNLCGVGTPKTVTTTDANLEENVWYFVVARYDQPNNDLRLEIYNDGTPLTLRTAVEETTTAFDAPDAQTAIYWGDMIGPAGVDLHLDNMFIADAYDEPLQDFANITSYTEYGAGAPAAPVLGRRFFIMP